MYLIHDSELNFIFKDIKIHNIKSILYLFLFILLMNIIKI